jgi:hypothetical protein
LFANASAGSIPAPGTINKHIYIYNKQKQTNKMKKVTMIFAAVVMFAVASCGAKKTEEVVATDSVAVEADTTAVDSAAVEVADSAAVEAAL